MKKLILLCIVVLVSCSGLKTYLPETRQTILIDVTEYQKEGFLITPQRYDGKYEAVGFINCIQKAEGNLVMDTSKSEFNTSGNRSETKVWIYKDLNVDDVIEEAYIKANNMGGDAIILLTLEKKIEFYENNEYPANQPYIEMNGYVIKRLDK